MADAAGPERTLVGFGRCAAQAGRIVAVDIVRNPDMLHHVAVPGP